ncbi:MAG: hypothetical protein K6G31_00005, partial [Paludibacteraceae bacterium]|nr:hypothetical protein [Paludibacteraceae bacterium]
PLVSFSSFTICLWASCPVSIDSLTFEFEEPFLTALELLELKSVLSRRSAPAHILSIADEVPLKIVVRSSAISRSSDIPAFFKLAGDNFPVFLYIYKPF